jgi:hypothetical protein
MLDMPFFMKNPEWFFFNGERFELTEKAPEGAKESLSQFYKDEAEMLKGETE